MGTPLFMGDVFQWARFCNGVVISDVRLSLSPHFCFVYLTTMVTYLDISFMFFQERKIILSYALH